MGRRVCCNSDASNWWGGWMSVQGPRPPPPATSRARAFRDRSGRGATCRNSAVGSGSHHSIGYRWPERSILVVLSTVNLSIQGPFVPIAFAASSQNSGSLCPGYSLVIMWSTSSTWVFSICKTAHRIRLRIVSMALEKELKVLDCA